MSLRLPAAVIEVCERAPAKINLALHVTGQRGDGYHDLDTIVTFANLADEIIAEPADGDSLSIGGPGARALANARSNLVTVARDRLRSALLAAGLPAPPVSLQLTKRLPIAGGIGGGSADAAATLRALERLWNARLTAVQMEAIALSIGADVPMCLAGIPARARGIGEQLLPLAPFPAFDMVLVNPGVPLATPSVFAALRERAHPPLACPAAWPASADAIDILSAMRNDLEPAARAIAPVITDALAALSGAGARLARMSGSGSTCFGLFDTAERARRAAREISRRERRWYVADCRSAYGLHQRPEGLRTRNRP